MPHNPFSPPSKRRGKAEPSSKTIANRRCEQRRHGLDLALKRDESAFRTAKSRKLAFFRRTTKQLNLHPVVREKLEKEIIVELEAQRDKKMMTHKMQWRKMVEKGVVSEDDLELGEDDDNDEEESEMQDVSVNKKDSDQSNLWIDGEELLVQDVSVDDDNSDSDSWIDEVEDEDEDEDEDSEVNNTGQSVYAATITTTFLDVLRVAKERWDEKMKVHEEKALEADKMWRAFDTQ